MANISNLSIKIFHRDAGLGQSDHEALYSFWAETWETTFAQLNETFESVSDHFSRQDTKIGFYIDGRPMAFSGISFFDIHSKMHMSHSYMKNYPQDLIEAWKTAGVSTIMPISYLSIEKGWRRSEASSNISSLLMASSLKVFVQSGADLAVGYTRNDRGVNQLSYAYGAQCECRDLDAHNVKVDIVSFEKNKLIGNLASYCPAEFDWLWKSAEIFESGSSKGKVAA